jgi:hypothetical protein
MTNVGGHCPSRADPVAPYEAATMVLRAARLSSSGRIGQTGIGIDADMERL